MEDEDILDTWCNYGIVIRIPYGKTKELKEWCRQKGYRVFYDIPTLKYIQIKTLEENPYPSSSGDKDNAL